VQNARRSGRKYVRRRPESSSPAIDVIAGGMSNSRSKPLSASTVHSCNCNATCSGSFYIPSAEETPGSWCTLGNRSRDRHLVCNAPRGLLPGTRCPSLFSAPIFNVAREGVNGAPRTAARHFAACPAAPLPFSQPRADVLLSHARQTDPCPAT
jgi:hypothetical protein